MVRCQRACQWQLRPALLPPGRRSSIDAKSPLPSFALIAENHAAKQHSPSLSSSQSVASTLPSWNRTTAVDSDADLVGMLARLRSSFVGVGSYGAPVTADIFSPFAPKHTIRVPREIRPSCRHSRRPGGGYGHGSHGQAPRPRHRDRETRSLQRSAHGSHERYPAQ